jgi:hypothetical protein
MFDDYNSPNGFNVHNVVNESENENEINVYGSTMFQNKDDYYPDYEKYSEQGIISPELKLAQEKLNVAKKENDSLGTVINTSNDDVVDPNTFFNNTSQVYLLYNLKDNIR